MLQMYHTNTLQGLILLKDYRMIALLQMYHTNTLQGLILLIDYRDDSITPDVSDEHYRMI